MKLRISDTIIGEVYNREMANRNSCYVKIEQLTKAAQVEFTSAEVEELKTEADYWNGRGVEENAGYVKAWRSLYKQIIKAGA
jgi:hypothetical protein